METQADKSLLTDEQVSSTWKDSVIAQIKKTIYRRNVMNKSETIGALALALSKAQGSYKPIVKNCINPFFKSKYADLASIIDSTKEALSKNELSLIQTNELTENGKLLVITTLLHSSGEWVSGSLSMKPVKDDPQSQGSCLTYLRRYAMQQMLGVAAEDDDDANVASQTDKPPIQPPQSKSEKAQQTQATTPLEAKETKPTIRAKIEKTSFKEGTTKKGKEEKKWTLYGILASGIWYNTFDKKFYDLANVCIGQEVTIVYQTQEKGNTLVDLKKDGCTGSPNTCEISVYVTGEGREESIAMCGEKPCPFST